MILTIIQINCIKQITKMMQSYSLDSLNLYYQKNCKDQCTGNKVESHQGNHGSLSYSNLAQIINMYAFCDDPPEIKNFIKEITQILTNIRDMADNALKQIKSQVSKYKLKTIFNLKTEDSINACLSLISGKVDQISRVRCCDLFDVFYKINYMDPSQLIFTNKSELQISQKITSKISEQINKNNLFFKKISAQRSNQKPNLKTDIKIQEEKNQSRKNQNDQYIQTRPARQVDNRKRQKAVSKQKNEQKTKSTYSSKRWKVAQLMNVSTDERFTICLKVVRIVKRFSIGNTRKIEFVGGDDTGVASCVLTEKPNIAERKTIEVTDCKVYNFKGKIKQIQSSADSRFYQGQHIKWVNFQFDLSKNKDKTDKGSQRQNKNKATYQKNSQYQTTQTKAQSRTPSEKKQIKKLDKISQIGPDRQDLSLIAQIYKIIGEQDDIIDCYIGDETGVVRAHLPRSLNFIKEGCSVKLSSVQANVLNEHIVLRLTPQSKIQPMNLTFAIIKITNDISAEEWAEVDDEQDDQ